MNIKHKFYGWAHVYRDLLLRNELTDVRAINRPDLSSPFVEQQEWYTFAGFFKPGYHQFIIYDPKVDRAFCQDFIAKLNQRDFVYPEYPLHLEFHLSLKIPSVWKQWKNDTPGDLTDCFTRESKHPDF